MFLHIYVLCKKKSFTRLIWANATNANAQMPRTNKPWVPQSIKHNGVAGITPPHTHSLKGP